MPNRQQALEDMLSVMPAVSTLVQVNEEKIPEIAKELAEKDIKVPNWGPPMPFFRIFPAENDDTFLRHILIGNALNFSFTDPETKEKFAVHWVPTSNSAYDDLPDGFNHTWVSSEGLWAALMRAKAEGINIYNGEVLYNITETDLKHIFRSAGGELPLLQQRAEFLREVGQFLSLMEAEGITLLEFMKYHSSFEKKQWDAVQIVRALKHWMPKTYDYDRYSAWELFGLDAPPFAPLIFDKRARLFALMYEGRARKSNGAFPCLSNLEEIGPVVDYQIPKTLRYFGLLEYNDDLAHMVDNEVFLIPHDPEEASIRIATHIAVEKLYSAVNEELSRVGKEQITMVEFDFLLWSMGRSDKEIKKQKHHLTLTTAY